MSDVRAENERILRDAVDWLFADAAARTAQRAFGKQVLEVNWEEGRIRTVNIDQRHTLRRDRGNCLPEVRPGDGERDQSLT